MKLTREQAARPSPPPLEANDQVVIWVGTAAWAVALVVLLIIRDRIPADQRWWIWTCVCGVAFGIFASWYVPRLKRGRDTVADDEQDHERDRPSGRPDPDDHLVVRLKRRRRGSRGPLAGQLHPVQPFCPSDPSRLRPGP